MYYSLTFDNEKNTWDDWKMIPTSPPQVPPPQPNLNLVDIPGGERIDLSRVPFGHLTYKRVSGSWSFLCEEVDPKTRVHLYEELRDWLHFSTRFVTLEDDPLHKWRGMFSINMPESGENTAGITINFDLDPYRYNLDGTVDTTYLPQ